MEVAHPIFESWFRQLYAFEHRSTFLRLPVPVHTPLNLVHLLNQSIDVLLPVTKVTSLNVVLELSWSETTVGI